MTNDETENLFLDDIIHSAIALRLGVSSVTLTEQELTDVLGILNQRHQAGIPISSEVIWEDAFRHIRPLEVRNLFPQANDIGVLERILQEIRALQEKRRQESVRGGSNVGSPR